jgi:hypothetical protein
MKKTPGECYREIRRVPLTPGYNTFEGPRGGSIYGLYEETHPGRNAGKVFLTYMHNSEAKIVTCGVYLATNMEPLPYGPAMNILQTIERKGGGFATLLTCDGKFRAEEGTDVPEEGDEGVLAGSAVDGDVDVPAAADDASGGDSYRKSVRA